MNDAEVRFKVTMDDNDVENKLDSYSKKSSNLTKTLSNVGKTMTVGVTLPLLGIATAGIKYNASIETYTANLTTLLNGNEEAAKALLSDLKQMASTTPFETSNLISATQTMMGFGIETKDAQKYLKQLGDISMGDASKLESLTLAFSQISSAGKLSGQDLLQMINAGFNPLNIISQKTGESMASLKERMSQGAISADEVAQAMQWATEEGGLFYGAMDKASQTTEGKLSTLKDEFNSAVGEMTTSLLPTFTKFVDKLTQIAQWFSNLSPKQQDFIVKMGIMLAAIGPVLTIVSKLITVGKTLSTVIGVINTVMAANPIGAIIIAIVALIAIFVTLYNKCEWFRNAVNGIVSFIANIFQGLWQGIKTGFRLALNGMIGYMNLWINGLNALLIPVRALIVAISKAFGKKVSMASIRIPNVPYLNVGTNYVEDEGLAYLHEGEAVVPKKYNPSAGGIGNGMCYVTLNANVEMDGTTVGKIVAPSVAQSFKRQGGF